MPINRITRFTIFALILFLFSCQSPEPVKAITQSVTDRSPHWEKNKCPFAVKRNEGVICGTLTVPEERSDPESPLIDLAVAIFPATNKRVKPDPIVYLEGGPGGSALSTPDFWLESPLRRARDLIVFDQRGTGYSQPALTCPPAEEVASESADMYLAERQVARACHAFWEAEGVNLAAYNSAANAADVADLRIALGIKEWNLYGISYGTRLALTVLRDHPEGVRSVVLDSVYPPNVDAYNEQAKTNADAILLLLDGCQADKACRKAFPKLEDHLYKLIKRLNKQPLDVDGVDWTGNDFVAFLVSSLYDTDLIPSLPRVIEAAYKKDYEPWQELEAAAYEEEMSRPRRLFEYSNRRGLIYQTPNEEVSDDAQGMFWSVECYEEAPFSELDKAEQALQEIPEELSDPLLADVENFYKVCKIWQVGEAPNLEDRAVISPIPTLIFAGQYDPITPPAWAKVAAKSLSNSFYFEAPRAGHGITTYWECPQQMMIAFLNDPSRQPNGSCLREEQLPFETE